METFRPRALRMRPTLAAVMPLPREEVTPPVTKTYFAMDQVLRGFFECYRKTPGESNRRAAPPPRDASYHGPVDGSPDPIVRAEAGQLPPTLNDLVQQARAVL